MFYSHTILAKKSPLGTVWIAAHLERRIKKQQIDSIHIPSYADCIMFPEVPIALRLSGHLLLGLARIYSWKVNYVFQDCNKMLTDVRTAFASVQVNLPEEADRAPFESVTLPETFELDAIELDASVYLIDGLDNHRKDYEQITITDELFGGEQYVAFSINEDIRTDTSAQQETSNARSGRMEEDRLPPFETHGVGQDVLATPIINSASSVDPHQSNQPDKSVPSIPGIEVARATVDNLESEMAFGWDDLDNDDRLPEKSASVPKRKGSLSPILEGLLASGEGPLPSASRAKQPSNSALDDHDILHADITPGLRLNLELQPSPVVRKQNSQKRRRKQFYDASIVLSNMEMKKQLEDNNKLVGKRKKLPCSTLDFWKYTRKRQNQVYMYEPLLSGMCISLQEVYQRNFPLISVDSGPKEASFGLGTSPLQDFMHDMDMEPELPRFGSSTETNTVSSRYASGQLSPLNSNVSSLPQSEFGKSTESNVSSVLETPVSNRRLSFEHEDHLSPLLEEQSVEHDFAEPSLLGSVDFEDFGFLEANSESAGYQSSNVTDMSIRTRAVAQYFKDHSPLTEDRENQSGCINLNNILEGKTRKQCARMFFESLVLKNFGFIDVHQEKAYGDIIITPTPALSTAKF